MLHETGKVIAVDADGVWVETLNQSACQQCRARHGCGQKLLAGAGAEFTCIKAMLPPEAGRMPAVGDQVTIGIEEVALVRGALLSYGLPLLAMLVSVALAAQLEFGEPGLIVAAVLGLVAGGLGVRSSASTLFGTRCLQAVVVSSRVERHEVGVVSVKSVIP